MEFLLVASFCSDAMNSKSRIPTNSKVIINRYSYFLLSLLKNYKSSSFQNNLRLKLYMRIDFTHYKYHNNKLSPLFTFYDQSTHIYEQAIYVVASNSSHFNGQFRILLGFLFQKVLLSLLSTMFMLFFSLDPLATSSQLLNTRFQLTFFVIVQF